MADVFISYQRKDRSVAFAMDGILRTRGFTTWWDASLVAGEQFNAAIDEQLRAARCVLVLWTRSSIKSPFVQAEALIGFKRQILVAARLESVDLIYPFESVQIASLEGWNGKSRHDGVDQVVLGIGSKVGKHQNAANLAIEGRAIWGRKTKLLKEHVARLDNALSERDNVLGAFPGIVAYWNSGDVIERPALFDSARIMGSPVSLGALLRLPPGPNVGDGPFTRIIASLDLLAAAQSQPAISSQLQELIASGTEFFSRLAGSQDEAIHVRGTYTGGLAAVWLVDSAVMSLMARLE